MRRLFILAALGLIAYTGNAQDTRNRGTEGTPQQSTARQIAGRVVDQTGAPLAGATVAVYTAGSLTPVNGSYTDSDGNYNFTTTANGALTVKITYVGLKDQVYSVPDGRPSMGVTTTMADASSALDEIVVTGFGGTIERRDLTGAVAKIGGAQLENVPMTSVESIMQGRAAGVQITQGSGKLGQGITVRVRGAASASAGNQPLYIVDGTPIVTEDVDNGAQGEPQSPIADLNPNDIESMDILKDASAAAIYGSRASNGVVIITTKRGKSGKARVNFNYYFGVAQPTRLRKFLNTAQYTELLGEYFGVPASLVYGPVGSGALIEDDQPIADTDWQREAYNFSAPVQQGDISVAGGNEKTTFYVAGSYFDQTGIFKGNTFSRATSSVNIDHRFNEKIKFGISTKFFRTQTNRPENDNQFNSLTQAVALWPMYRSKSPLTGDYNTGIPYDNPFLFVDNSRTRSVSYRNFTTLFMDFEFIKGLVYHADLGIDFLDNQYDQWVGPRAGAVFSSFSNGYATSQSNRITNLNTKHYVTFSHLFNEVHNLIAVGGFEFLRQNNELSFAQGEGFPSNEFQYVSAAANPVAVGSGYSDYAFVSYFARVNYKFSDKYMVQLSGRYDGSSRFGVNNRYGFFPSVSAGWTISNESFMEGISFLSLLKLRGGWGLTGNGEIGNFTSRKLSGASAYRDAPGIIPNQLGNPDLKWETTSQVNIGLDFGLFKDRITGQIDFFRRTTNDLLLNVPIPVESGFNSIIQNLGKIRNEGIEITLTTQNTTGALKWNTTFNFTTIRNEVLETGRDGAPIIFNTRGIENRVQIGQPLGYFFGRRQVGVDPQTGFAQYRRADGSITNSWNQGVVEPLGNSYPTMFGGISNEFRYKNIDLSFLWNYSFGNYIYWGTGIYSSTGFSAGFDNQTEDQMSRWRNPGDITGVPALGTLLGNGEPSSRLLYKADYVRLRNVTLGYTFPESITRKFSLRSLRVYVMGQNLILISPYPGDPEIGSQAGIANTGVVQGIDFYTAPQARSFQGGIQIGF